MLKKVALYDFDNTIASGDTIVRLLKYDLKKHPVHFFYFFKSALLFPLDHMNNSQLKTFYENEVVPSYYPHMIEQMEKEHQQGYIVIVCTASCEVYMKYHQLPADYLIGTRTLTKNGQPTSTVIGKNCKGEGKVPRILECLKSQNIEIDFENSIGYSDSTSDLPMLALVKNRKRIALKTGQISDF